MLRAIAVSVGPLLLWLDHTVDIPRHGPVGWALIVGPVVLVAVLNGTAVTATTGVASGALLLASAAVGFRDLRRKAGDLRRG